MDFTLETVDRRNARRRRTGIVGAIQGRLRRSALADRRRQGGENIVGGVGHELFADTIARLAFERTLADVMRSAYDEAVVEGLQDVPAHVRRELAVAAALKHGEAETNIRFESFGVIDTAQARTLLKAHWIFENGEMSGPTGKSRLLALTRKPPGGDFSDANLRSPLDRDPLRSPTAREFGAIAELIQEYEASALPETHYGGHPS